MTILFSIGGNKKYFNKPNITTMEKFEYKVIHNMQIDNLTLSVNQMIKNGFYPHGSLVYVDNNENEIVPSGFYQPMIKENIPNLDEFIQ